MPFFDHYPYTNFHNVNLDWVLQAVKSWGALVEQNNQNFINLAAANESFKEYINAHIAEYEEYVTNYLQNLDVQDEINTKLDRMLETGQLLPYMQPYISTDVSGWLAEHITPTTPPLDTSLTVAGAAADAKAVGDRFASFDPFSDAAKENLLSVLMDTVYTNSNEILKIENLADALNYPLYPGQNLLFDALGSGNQAALPWNNRNLWCTYANRWVYRYPATITAIKAQFSTTGSLQIGKKVISEITSNNQTFTVTETITVQNTGLQRITLATPITLNEGECLALGPVASGTSAVFRFNATNNQGCIIGFRMGTASFSTQTCGLKIYGTM